MYVGYLHAFFGIFNYFFNQIEVNVVYVRKKYKKFKIKIESKIEQAVKVQKNK